MKLLISTSATKKVNITYLSSKTKPKATPAKPVFVKPSGISPEAEKKLDALANKAVKARTRTLANLEKAIAAFKKKYPPLQEKDVKAGIIKDLLKTKVHPDYVSADGSFKFATNNLEEVADDCNIELPLELFDDMLQEIYDTFRQYF